MRRGWLLLCLGLLSSRVAVAQQPAGSEDVTKEFQAGVDAYRLGKYDEARQHLQKARSMDPKLPGPHRFLAALGQVQSRWSECIESAHKALELNPASSEASDTRKLYESCRISAGRTPARQELGDSAAVAVTTNVVGATVKINGLTYGGTPLAPRPITAGSLDVEIEKPGWKPAKQTVNAIAGVVTDVIVDLEADPNAQSGTDLEVRTAKIKNGYLVVPPGSGTLTIDEKPAPAPVGDRFELLAGTHTLQLEQSGKDLWRRRVRIAAGQKTTVTPEFVDTAQRSAVETRGFYIVGAGAALLAAGFGTAMISRNAADEARDIARIERTRDASRSLSETAMISPVRTRADLQDARDKSAKFAVISDGLYAVGFVTAGVGAYFLYKGARQRRDVPPPFAIAPMHGGAMIAKELAW
ncbi:MAG TPA: PEGA domain-containing protein [Kofleriaceae bacterium]|nr:PEGA domain-containing protein [Kofleriaceae bacterium]